EYFLYAPEGYDAAAEFAHQMMGIAEDAGSATGAALALLMLGEAELLAGRLDEAEEHLKGAADANDREGCISGAALARQRLAAAASARAGELDRARSFIAEAERIAGMWQGGLWTGAVWEARGILRQVEGEGEQARAMFREAAQAFAHTGNESDAARCLQAAAG